jgi:hypothetical protein
LNLLSSLHQKIGCCFVLLNFGYQQRHSNLNNVERMPGNNLWCRL